MLFISRTAQVPEEIAGLGLGLSIILCVNYPATLGIVAGA
jgi:hypothetical protein